MPPRHAASAKTDVPRSEGVIWVYISILFDFKANDWPE